MNSILVCAVLLIATNLYDRLGHVAGTQQVHRLNGIPVSKIPLYQPDVDFQCLDGSSLIPFTHVNDDYCDCSDGSDEPGTAACSNGSFYCKNAGYQAAYIPSSWVNDGICDCCDGTDEYMTDANCIDNCKELGRQALLEAQKAAKLVIEGNKIRLEMLGNGKQLKGEYQTRLAKLLIDQKEVELIKKEKEAIKNRAEERESAALEKYKPVQPEQTSTEVPKDEEESHESEAESYFKLLDSDGSSTITLIELQTRVTFDKNRDGEVSEEEALFFLNNKAEVTLEEFIETAWPIIKPFLMLEQGMFKPEDQTPEHEEEESEHEEVVEEEENIDQEKEEDENLDNADEDDKPPEEPESQYDEETQMLIDEATTARHNYEEAEKAANELMTEIRKLEERLERDYGPEEEFASLDGECFEFADLEYIYSLCLFGKTSQRSKSGGNDISLGHFYDWVGPEGNKYSEMKYDRGLTCWNGPARSVVVLLTCGTENKLVSVAEPNRCEYAMEFVTPALCNPGADTATDNHDEL